ncbi:DUF1934 family protein [Carnobacteriaceae bacterium zg-ZUI78]|nr:DUF1934 family protein [Carnobacteriaceae bacterium zg-ZUI78]
MRKVKINFISTIKQENVLKVKKEYIGHLIEKNHCYYLRYKDVEYGKVTVKYDKVTHTITCLWENHHVKRMVFSMEYVTEMLYQLPQSHLLLDVHTMMLDVDIFEDLLKKIVFAYQLKEKDDIFGEYTIQYDIRPC